MTQSEVIFASLALIIGIVFMSMLVALIGLLL